MIETLEYQTKRSLLYQATLSLTRTSHEKGYRIEAQARAKLALVKPWTYRVVSEHSLTQPTFCRQSEEPSDPQSKGDWVRVDDVLRFQRRGQVKDYAIASSIELVGLGDLIFHLNQVLLNKNQDENLRLSFPAGDRLYVARLDCQGGDLFSGSLTVLSDDQEIDWQKAQQFELVYDSSRAVVQLIKTKLKRLGDLELRLTRLERS